jgi:class 3 adenylate cyclase
LILYIGGTTKLKYELLGEAVETAEAVQAQASPGSVYISDTTAQALQRINDGNKFVIRQTRKVVDGHDCFLLE